MTSLCGCDSVLFHKVTCQLTHPELAALPKEMPENVLVMVLSPKNIAIGVRRHANDAPIDPEATTLCLMVGESRYARAVARELLLKADEADREASLG